MNYFNIIFKLFLLLCFIQISSEAGPTQRHVDLHSMEEIIQDLQPEFQEKVPQLLEIAEHEDEETFFGYHGMSQNNRLFQDILNVVFQEVLNVPIKNDFYFLRIPGESTWNWKNGKQDFLNHFGNRSVSQKHKDLILKNFLLILEKELGYHFTLEDLNASEYATFWNFFQDNIDYRIQTNWIRKAKTYCMPVDYKWEKPISNKNLSDVVTLITKKAFKIDPKVDTNKIKEWSQNNLKDSYNTAIIFQLRELGMEYKKDVQEIDTFDLPFDDTQIPQQEMLVSLNTSLFGNYVDSGCFTAGIFLQNESVLGGDSYLEEKLKDFFSCIGLEPSLASMLWKEGQKMLIETHENSGCLLQFFDDSAKQDKNAFSLLNQDTYISFKHGVPVVDLVPSDYVQGFYSLKKKRKDLELRLVVNNQTTLNPFSTLRMVRYNSHFNESQNSTKVILALKEILKNASRDESKVQSYLDLLEELWNVPLRN